MLTWPKIGCMKAQEELAALTQVGGSTHGNTRVLCLRGPRLLTFLPTCLLRCMVRLSDLGFRSSLC